MPDNNIKETKGYPSSLNIELYVFWFVFWDVVFKENVSVVSWPRCVLFPKYFDIDI